MTAEITVDKTLYDGRLHFHKRLDSLWTAFHNFSLAQNWSGCGTALNGILIETSGLINKENETQYIKKLDMIMTQAQALIGNNKINSNTINNYTISKELRDLSIAIRTESKKLYIPFEELDSEFDEKKFMSETG